MLKAAFTIIFGIFFSSTLLAQKRADTVVYYLKNSGKVVSSKDSADYFLVILPPDTNIDKSLFVAKEFYPNGGLKLMGGSTSNSLKTFKFQGPYIAFFPNGHKKVIRNYENGEPVGDEIQYYPNGKLYNVRSYVKDGRVFLKQFNDSTGNILAEDGKGRWIQYNESFSDIDAEGPVDNGVEDGAWHGRLNDSVGFDRVFNKGKLTIDSRIVRYKQNGEFFTSVEVVPEFPGGIEALYVFLEKNMHYPALARENGVQGRVIISFVVERDGNLSNIKVTRGIGDGCDEEAVRVIKLCPPWKPGMQNGKPVRVAYSVPISFTLEGRSGFISH